MHLQWFACCSVLGHKWTASARAGALAGSEAGFAPVRGAREACARFEVVFCSIICNVGRFFFNSDNMVRASFQRLCVSSRSIFNGVEMLQQILHRGALSNIGRCECSWRLYSIVLRGQDFRGRIASSYDKRKEHTFLYNTKRSHANACTSVNACSKYSSELRRV